MSLQYHTWDRFKDLSLLNKQQLANFGSTLSQLLLSKSITLNIFKVTIYLNLISLLKKRNQQDRYDIINY